MVCTTLSSQVFLPTFALFQRVLCKMVMFCERIHGTVVINADIGGLSSCAANSECFHVPGACCMEGNKGHHQEPAHRYALLESNFAGQSCEVYPWNYLFQMIHEVGPRCSTNPSNLSPGSFTCLHAQSAPVSQTRYAACVSLSEN